MSAEKTLILAKFQAKQKAVNLHKDLELPQISAGSLTVAFWGAKGDGRRVGQYTVHDISSCETPLYLIFEGVFMYTFVRSQYYGERN